MENETIKIEIDALTIPKAKEGLILQKSSSQKIEFITDKYIKHKKVAMVLTSDFGGINAPEHEIYIDYQNLQKILTFLKNV